MSKPFQKIFTQVLSASTYNYTLTLEKLVKLLKIINRFFLDSNIFFRIQI